MSDAGEQIRNLIHRYSEAVDEGRFEVLDELFAFATVRTAAGRAAARSYNTTLQQVPGRGIEIIATARYEDSFVLVGGAWRFSERVIRHTSMDGVHRDFIGDMSLHTRNAPPPPPVLES